MSSRPEPVQSAESLACASTAGSRTGNRGSDVAEDAPTLVGAPRRVGPWYFATLVLTCPACGVGPGTRCTDGGYARRRYHVERYELARQLAGIPIRHSRRRGAQPRYPD